MKRCNVLLLLCLVMASNISVHAQSDANTKIKDLSGDIDISGIINGLEVGDEVILQKVQVGYLTSSGVFESLTVDSFRVVKDGEFRLHTKSSDGARYYLVQIFSIKKQKGRVCSLLLDNGQKVFISSNAYGRDVFERNRGGIDNVLTISGSPTYNTWKTTESAFRMYNAGITYLDRALRKIKDSIGFNPYLIEGIIKAREKLTEAYINNFLIDPIDSNIEPFQSEKARPYILYQAFPTSGHHAKFMDAYGELSEENKNSYYGRLLKRYVELAVGQDFPKFSLPNLNGQLVNSKEIFPKNKLTIVHFWGSGDYKSSTAVRSTKEMHSELKMYLKKYQQKGLNIIGVASEDSSSLYDYNKTLREEALPWVNVSELKGNMLGSIINDVYFEGGDKVPNLTNVLVNNEGKIVAWDVSGGVLQYYLWKYLGD